MGRVGYGVATVAFRATSWYHIIAPTISFRSVYGNSSIRRYINLKPPSRSTVVPVVEVVEVVVCVEVEDDSEGHTWEDMVIRRKNEERRAKNERADVYVNVDVDWICDSKGGGRKRDTVGCEM